MATQSQIGSSRAIQTKKNTKPLIPPLNLKNINGSVLVRKLSEPILLNRPTSNKRTEQSQLNKCERFKRFLFNFIFTLIFAFLLIVTIQLTTIIVNRKYKYLYSSNQTWYSMGMNTTNDSFEEESHFPIQSHFLLIWLSNLLLLFTSFFAHLHLYRRHSQQTHSLSQFIREILRIYYKRKSSSNYISLNSILKILFLCCTWYLFCYLILRATSILYPTQLIVFYSIKVTLRQILGWICLQEQFAGNKVIGHIVGLSGLVCLTHDGGLRFNKNLFGFLMLLCAVTVKMIFEIVFNVCNKNVTTEKFRIFMINICLFGTLLFSPFALFYFRAQFHLKSFGHFHGILLLIIFISLILFHLLTMLLSYECILICKVTCLVIVIPSTYFIEIYWLTIKYSLLVSLSIVCLLSSILLSMIPKRWLERKDPSKIKQALLLIGKDSTSNLPVTSPIATATFSAFQDIRNQSRMKDSLLN